MVKYVYIVLSNDCIYQVFSTREKAEIQASTMKNSLVEIVEIELN